MQLQLRQRLQTAGCASTPQSEPHPAAAAAAVEPALRGHGAHRAALLKQLRRASAHDEWPASLWPAFRLIRCDLSRSDRILSGGLDSRGVLLQLSFNGICIDCAGRPVNPEFNKDLPAWHSPPTVLICAAPSCPFIIQPPAASSDPIALVFEGHSCQEGIERGIHQREGLLHLQVCVHAAQHRQDGSQRQWRAVACCRATTSHSSTPLLC